jgi:hypothetical protein
MPNLEQASRNYNFALKNGYINPQTDMYTTPLSPREEEQFRQDLYSGNLFPGLDPQEMLHPMADYDYRGYWKALTSGDPRAASSINEVDGRMHYPDTWKTPFHDSFSAESQYANPDTAPNWNDKDQLIDPKTGKVIFAERYPLNGFLPPGSTSTTTRLETTG